MMTTLRTSRKSALILTVGVIVLIITMLAFKDLNEKLDVMTASNAGYQKMTDSQSDKIRNLVSEINDLKELHQKNVKSMKETESKLKSKLTKAESEVSDLGTVQQDLEKLRSEFDTLSKNHLRTTEELNRAESEVSELKKSNSGLEKAKDALAIELRDQIAQLSLDRDTYKRQYTALFKQHQENEDAIGVLQKEKDRLEIQIQDLTRQQEQQWQPQQQQQQPQQVSSSPQFPVVQHPNGPTGMGSPSTSSTRKEQQLGPQVNLEEPQGVLLGKGSASISSTTQGVKSAVQEGVGIAQPPLAGPAPPNQPEFVLQVGKEDVMEAPGLHDQPFFKQPKQQQQQQQQQQPLRQPRQRQPLVPQQFVQQPRQQPELPYLQQQQQQLFHNNLLNGQFRNNQPILNSGYQNRNLIGGGENLDQQVDHIQQDHPDLLGEHAVQGGHLGLDDYEGDDAADGQLENQHYPVMARKKDNLKANNDVEYDPDQVHDNRYDTFAINNHVNNINNNFARKAAVKNPYLQNQPVVYPNSNNNNNNRPIRYLAQPPVQQARGRPYRDF